MPPLVLGGGGEMESEYHFTEALRYRTLALECRHLAQYAADNIAERSYRKLAEQFVKLAEEHESWRGYAGSEKEPSRARSSVGP